MASRRASPGASGAMLALCFFALVALGIKAPEFLLPMGPDRALYHYLGQTILEGGLPYRDVWDVKPPGVYFTHAAVLALADAPWRACSIGPIDGLAPRPLNPFCGSLLFQAFDYLYTLAIGLVVFAIARLLGFSLGSAALANGLAVAFASLAVSSGEGNIPEKYLLLPAGLAVAAVLRFLHGQRHGWLAVAGVAGAMAFLYKQPGIASLVAASLYLALACLKGWHGLRPAALPRLALWLGLPFGGVLALVYGAFAARGVGFDLIDATVLYNLARPRFELQQLAVAAAAAFWRVARDGMALLWLLAALGLLAARRVPSGLLLVLWAVLDVLALFLGGTKLTRVYFMQLVPSFSLLAALALHQLWAHLSRPAASASARRLAQLWLALSCASLLVFTNQFQAHVALRAWNDFFSHGWTTTSVEDLARALQVLPADETVLVWGDIEQVYLLADRPAPTRFIHTVGVTVSGDDSVFRRRAELMAALERQPPAVIVVDQLVQRQDPQGHYLSNLQSFPELSAFLDRFYQRSELTQLRGRPDFQADLYTRLAPQPVCPSLPGCRSA